MPILERNAAGESELKVPCNGSIVTTMEKLNRGPYCWNAAAQRGSWKKAFIRLSWFGYRKCRLTVRYTGNPVPCSLSGFVLAWFCFVPVFWNRVLLFLVWLCFNLPVWGFYCFKKRICGRCGGTGWWWGRGPKLKVILCYHGKFKASLGCIRPCLKLEKKWNGCGWMQTGKLFGGH